MGNAAILFALFISFYFALEIAANRHNPLGDHHFRHSSDSRLHHNHQDKNHLNHKEAPSLELKYEESSDSVTWIPKPITDEPYKYEKPPSLEVSFRPKVRNSNHRLHIEYIKDALERQPTVKNHQNIPQDAFVRQPVDFTNYPSGYFGNQEPANHEPDKEYMGRISYNFQKPHNTYDEENPTYQSHWPNHRYQLEFPSISTTPPSIKAIPNLRPIIVRTSNKPDSNTGHKHRVPGRRKPPPGWDVVTFQVNDGNRTIHVRRFVRRPPGVSNSANRPRPLSNFFLMRPLYNATVASQQNKPAEVGEDEDEDEEEEEEEEEDLQTAETLGLPSWGSSPTNDLPHLTKSKLAKFLSLFTVIRFANTPCPSAQGVPGTCFHRLECMSMGGLASGTCASGFGVCCLFQLTCGGQTAQNCSYFVNPGWPSAATTAATMNCQISVEKLPGVTQVRLDLLTFELAMPSNGLCIDQQFVISGQNVNSVVPTLCGDNTGQHVYADVDAVRGPVRLAALGGGGRYRVKVTQLREGDARSAPRGCTQYLQGPRGILRSFNYAGGAYTNDLNYAICIRKETGYCSITYSVRSNNNETSFQLVNVDQDGEPLVPPGQAGAEAFNCPDDYIIIGGLRLCGERLNDASIQLDFTQNAPVTDTTNGPFIVNVRTNGNTVGRGFELEYRQNPCRN